MNGPSQLPGAMALPNSGSARPGPHASQLRRAAMKPRASSGRIHFRWRVMRSYRDRPRYWDSVYRVRLSVVSIRLTNPSPPPVLNQSSARIPSDR